MKRVIADFVKLSGENYTNSKIRRFVLLVCQQKIPKEFVTKKGDSKRGILRIPTLFFEDVNVRVTRTCKSTFSFKPNAIGKANYVCLIEVL